MGGGIALSLALAGCDTRLWGRRREGVDAARSRVAADAAFLVEQGLVDEGAAGRAVAAILFTGDWERALVGADLALEAVSEDLALKQELLTRAEAALTPEAFTSSTTSTLRPTL